MPEIDPITREEKLWNGEDIEPITREEMYIKHIYDKTQKIPSKPITRKEMLLEKAGQGGGSDVTIKQLSVTANGTYSEENTAYSPVIVNVPKTPLSKLTVTENGTYTAPTGTGYDEVEVDVPLPSNAYLLKDIPNTPIDIATFTDGSALPMPKLKVAIEPIQEGSGDPSPENVRHISGHTEANVSVCGVNIWDEEWEVGGLNPLNGETTSENDRIRSKNFRPCKPNMTMFYYIPSGKENLQIVFYDINKNYLGYYNFTTEHTFTIPNGCYFFKFNTGGSYGTTYNNDISINYPSTDTSYHAYNGRTYTIQFKDGSNPLTVYGGSLDVVSGELVVDRVTCNVTSVSRNTTSSYYYIISSGELPKIDNFETVISDKLPTAINSVSVGVFINKDGAIRINTPNEYASARDMLTAYGGSIQVVYELATPQTYQLTPTQVKSLLGTNNVWADTGDIEELEYFSKEA